MNLENLPEVIEAGFYLSMGQPVGQDLYNRIRNTVAKYPEHFPWETKYNSIDDSVHKKYEEEKSVLFNSFFPRTPMDIQPGEGIMAWSKRQNVQTEPLTYEKLKSILDGISARDKKEKEYSEAVKKLWNKHYKKYKLKYRY